MEDKELTCSWNMGEKPCGEKFIWTVRDQEFYKEKDFKQPRYCRPHREARRKKHEDSLAPMPPPR